MRRHLAHVIRVRPDRRFGRATHRHELTVGAKRAVARGQVQADPVARQHRCTQRRRRAQREAFGIGEQHVEQRGHAVPECHPMAFDAVAPDGRVAPLRFVDEHQRAACGKHAEDVIDRQVEVQRGQREHAIVGTHAVAAVQLRARVERAAVRDHDALRRAGRAGRVDHVGRRARIDRDGIVQRVGGHRVLPCQGPRRVVRRRNRAGIVAAHEHPLHRSIVVDLAAPRFRLIKRHGHVDRARMQHAEHRDDLPDTL